MNIRCGWVNTELDAQGAAERELLAQFGSADDLCSTLLQQPKRLIRFHGANCRGRRSGGKVAYLFLFSNSRTSSIVIGALCRSNDFWLFPRPRNGRSPA